MQEDRIGAFFPRKTSKGHHTGSRKNLLTTRRRVSSGRSVIRFRDFAQGVSHRSTTAESNGPNTLSRKALGRYTRAPTTALLGRALCARPVVLTGSCFAYHPHPFSPPGEGMDRLVRFAVNGECVRSAAEKAAIAEAHSVCLREVFVCVAHACRASRASPGLSRTNSLRWLILKSV